MVVGINLFNLPSLSPCVVVSFPPDCISLSSSFFLFLSFFLCMSAYDEANYCPAALPLIITECSADPAFVLQ